MGARFAWLAPCGVLGLLMWEAWPVTVDDAFITLRHARNWVELGNLSFDPAERIEAYSSFTAVALAAAVLGLGGDPVLASKWLGALCGLALVPATFGLARRLDVHPGVAGLGALLLALSTGVGFWAVSGMETTLFALALTAGVLLLVDPERRFDAPAAACLLLVCLTRLEGPVLVGAALAARVGLRWAEGRDAARVAREHAWAAGLVVGYGLYFLWRWQHYGHLFPSPIYFKRLGAVGDVWESHGAAFVASSFPLLGLAVAAPWLGGRRAWVPLAVVLAALVTFSSAREEVLGGVSTMAWFDRYFVPVLPCVVAAAMASLDGIRRRLGPSPPRRVGLGLAAALLALWQLANPAANPLRLLARSRAYPQAVAVRNLPAASYLEERFGPAGRVVAGDVGLLGYVFRGTLWDLFGLASYDRTGRHAGALEPYVEDLLARAPDAILLCYDAEAHDPPRPCQHAERVLAGRPGFRSHYVRAAVFGRDEFPQAHHVIFVRSPGLAD